MTRERFWTCWALCGALHIRTLIFPTFGKSRFAFTPSQRPGILLSNSANRSTLHLLKLIYFTRRKIFKTGQVFPILLDITQFTHINPNSLVLKENNLKKYIVQISPLWYWIEHFFYVRNFTEKTLNTLFSCGVKVQSRSFAVLAEGCSDSSLQSAWKYN